MIKYCRLKIYSPLPNKTLWNLRKIKIHWWKGQLVKDRKWVRQFFTLKLGLFVYLLEIRYSRFRVKGPIVNVQLRSKRERLLSYRKQWAVFGLFCARDRFRSWSATVGGWGRHRASGPTVARGGVMVNTPAAKELLQSQILAPTSSANYIFSWYPGLRSGTGSDVLKLWPYIIISSSTNKIFFYNINIGNAKTYRARPEGGCFSRFQRYV